MTKALGLFFVLFLFMTATASAETDNRSAHPFGFLFSVDGDPAPSILGLNAAANLGGLARLEAGAGAYNQWMNPADWGIGMYNWIVRPIFAMVAYSFSVSFVKNPDHRRTWFTHIFKAMAASYLPNKSVFTYGGGADFMVPGWNLSPAAGIHWSHYHAAHQPWGLDSTARDAYYLSLGGDWQSKDGFEFGLGVNLCHGALKNACGFYVSLGGFH
jgi:hypothetical protein